MCNLLTTLRNGQRFKKKVVVVEKNFTNSAILENLSKEGYIGGYYTDNENEAIAVKLKYSGRRQNPVIRGIRPVSRPSKRVECGHPVPNLLNGLGTVLVRLENGEIVIDKEARFRQLGGEVLCEIW